MVDAGARAAALAAMQLVRDAGDGDEAEVLSRLVDVAGDSEVRDFSLAPPRRQGVARLASGLWPPPSPSLLSL
jgi:hypothetical protein